MDPFLRLESVARQQELALLLGFALTDRSPWLNYFLTLR